MQKLKKSRNVLATTVLLGALLSGGKALAEESNPNAVAENLVETTENVEEIVQMPVNVEGFWYKFDKFLQDLQITFTTDDEKKVKLLMSVAKERLEEAKIMNETEQIEFLDVVLADYLKKLEEAEELVSEMIIDGDAVEEVKEELTEKLEELTEVDEEIEENLSDELKEELDEVVERVTIVANVVKGIDPELVTSLREQNLGFGQIAHIVALAEVSGKTVEEVATFFTGENKKGFGQVVKELGYHPGEIAVKVKETRLKAELEEATLAGDDKRIAKLEKKLTKLEDRQAKFANKRDRKPTEDTEVEKQEEIDKADKGEELVDESSHEIIVVSKKEEGSQQIENREQQVKKHDEKAEKKEEKQREQLEKREEKRQEQAEKREEKRQEHVQKQQEKTEKKEEKQRERVEKDEGNSKGRNDQKDS